MYKGKGKSKKIEAESDKRFRDSTSDESMTQTPMKQQKISDLFNRDVAEMSEEGGEHNPTIESVLGNMQKLETLLRRIIKEEVSRLTEQIIHLTEDNKKLKDNVMKVEKENLILKYEINNLEQYTRRENIRIFGVKDSAWEQGDKSTTLAIDIIKTKMKINIREEDIEAAHRVGRFKADKNRAIIVRFSSRRVKERVMVEKKKLKGTGIFVSEDLTKMNIMWFFTVKKIEGVTNKWTKNGETFVRNVKTNEIIKVVKDYDLKKLEFQLRGHSS